MAEQLAPDLAALGRVTAFQDLPESALRWLLQAGQLWRYPAGEVIIPAGSPADRLLAVVSGTIQYYSSPAEGKREPRFRLEAGRVGGMLPYSRLQVFRGQAEAVGDTVLYTLPRTEFGAMEQTSPELVQRLVAIMSDRARDEVRAQERDDKLRALGKLSAGLAHELNNPAAALVRAAALLRDLLQAKPQRLHDLLTSCPPAKATMALLAAPLPAPAPPRSALARADCEEELADWLEAQGCPDGYALAPGLLDAGHTAATLAPLVLPLPPAARPPALAWLEGHLSALHLTRDLHEASQRISGLVNNIKAYSHMDRAGGRERLDVAAGLDSTLNLFAYALRQKNVQLTRAYAPDAPPVVAQAGQLNQVWTNLIDNALDALPASGGQLTVQASPHDGGLAVRIIDNGSGIAPEVLAHIFEPFYTTKPAGEGSGLGLDIARRIVQEHGGRLEAQSTPGRTEFTVWLPAAS